jgi:hypothetical protein
MERDKSERARKRKDNGETHQPSVKDEGSISNREMDEKKPLKKYHQL